MPKENNIIKFPTNPSKLERQVEAILFSASEPLDIETIEKRIQTTTNIKKILENSIECLPLPQAISISVPPGSILAIISLTHFDGGLIISFIFMVPSYKDL